MTYPNSRINSMAVVSFVFGLTICLSFAAIFAGVSALRQIRHGNGRGRWLALTGLTIGTVVNGGALILTGLSFVLG